MKTLFSKSIFWFCILALGSAPFISGASSLSPQQSNDGGKQIVFILGDPNSKFIHVTISGHNQNNDWVTWSKENQAGFSLAYTKDWWWVKNFVQINFVIQDNASFSTYSGSCLIDALEQPADSPRVEIVYKKDFGCAGGDAGSAIDPVHENIIQPINNAFAQITYYTQDFDGGVFVDRFLETVDVEASASECIIGVGGAFYSGGALIALDAAAVEDSCPDTGEKIIGLYNDVSKDINKP